MTNKLSVKDMWMKSWKDNLSPRIRCFYWTARARFAETILKIFVDIKTFHHAEHIYYLEEKIRNQAGEITNIQGCLEDKNRLHKALNILIACDGNCNRSYMDNPELIDENFVKLVERNALRLRHWWDRGGHEKEKEYRERFVK